MSYDRRTSSRFDTDAKVTISYLEGSRMSTEDAQLMDVSIGGAKLDAAREMRVGSMLVLNLEEDPESGPIYAKVVRAHLGTTGRHTYGLKLMEGSFPYKMFSTSQSSKGLGAGSSETSYVEPPSQPASMPTHSGSGMSWQNATKREDARLKNRRVTRPFTPACMRRLGLEMPCSKDDIKRRYREMAKELHPDNGGSPIAFSQLRQSFDEAMTYLDRLSEAGLDG